MSERQASSCSEYAVIKNYYARLFFVKYLVDVIKFSAAFCTWWLCVCERKTHIHIYILRKTWRHSPRTFNVYYIAYKRRLRRRQTSSDTFKHKHTANKHNSNHLCNSRCWHMFICNEDANLLWQTKKNNSFRKEKQQNMLPGTKH